MKKLALSITALVVSLVLLGTGVYAWIAAASNFSEIRFSVSAVNASVALERGQDFNYDGNLDRDPDGTERYEAVAGAFSNPQTQWGPANVAPGRIYTYRVKVENTGELSAKVTVLIENTADGFSVRAAGGEWSPMTAGTAAVVTAARSIAVGASDAYVFSLRLDADADGTFQGSAARSMRLVVRVEG